MMRAAHPVPNMPADGGERPVFTVEQTRGIAGFAARKLLCSSDDLGWTGLHVSHQLEQPFHGNFAARADHLFVLHRQGAARVELRQGSRQIGGAVAPGAMSVLPGGGQIALRLHAPVETIHLSLRVRPIGSDGASDDPTPTPAPSLGQNNPGFYQLTQIAADMMYAGCGDRLAGSVASMLTSEIAVQAGQIRRARLTPAQFHDVYHFLRQHLDQPVRLHDLAAVACSSAVNFSRRFREGTGWSPHQFLISLRLAAARSLLKTGEPLAQIALQCGFAHQEHMTRLFRQWWGVTPAACRRQFRREG